MRCELAFSQSQLEMYLPWWDKVSLFDKLNTSVWQASCAVHSKELKWQAVILDTFCTAPSTVHVATVALYHGRAGTPASGAAGSCVMCSCHVPIALQGWPNNQDCRGLDLTRLTTITLLLRTAECKLELLNYTPLPEQPPDSCIQSWWLLHALKCSAILLTHIAIFHEHTLKILPSFLNSSFTQVTNQHDELW